jgi:hypothetical protein
VFKNLNVKAKGSFSNFGQFRSFGAKWVRIGAKGLFCKKQVLTFKP